MLNISDKSRIFVTGDLHGVLDISKLSSKRWSLQKKLTDSDVLIQVGDFGFVWDAIPSKEELYWLDWFDKKPYYTLFIGGNHENHRRLDSYDVVDFYGGKASFISKKVIHLKNGYVYQFGNRKFWVFGGAVSTDKEYRTPGVSWWEEEVPSLQTMNLGIDNLFSAGFDIDYIITHTAPACLTAKLGGDENKPCFVASYLDTVMKHFLDSGKMYKHWYCGHWHVDETFSTERISVLYNNAPTEIDV